jgi:hypothetical protein
VTEPTAQRHWQAACPNCGAPVEFASAASVCAVCSFCRSTLLRDGESLKKIGVSAELFEDYSPLQIGSAGRFAGEAFTLVGRLQLSYAQGSWNEWHALFDSGPNGQKSGWLSEDNGSFVFSFDAPLSEAIPRAHELTLGERRILGGQGWSVAALTMTTLAAAQGELPRPPVPGRKYLVAELRNAQDEVGSLEYSDEEHPQWSVGRSVRLADLALTNLREEQSKNLASRSLPCPNCGAALEPKLESTQSITCPQCSSVVDISAGAGAELAHFKQQAGRPPQIPLGSTGTLALGDGQAVPWQVVGYQERCDIPETSDDETSFWREYLLFNKTEGFAFLVDAEDGWSLVRPLTGAPQLGGSSVEWQGQRYALKYRYKARTTHVLGEFYWRVQKDDVADVTDYDGGAMLMSREQTGEEITWSQGRKLPASAVINAFRLQSSAAALARDATPGSGTSLIKRIMIALIIILVIILLVRACSHDDCDSYKNTYGASSTEYAQCLNSHGGGRIYPSGGGFFGGGSFGGSGSGGGHK